MSSCVPSGCDLAGFQLVLAVYGRLSCRRAGLTGKVAEWAVHKQKSHCQVGPRAMMSVAAIVN